MCNTRTRSWRFDVVLVSLFLTLNRFERFAFVLMKTTFSFERSGCFCCCWLMNK